MGVTKTDHFTASHLERALQLKALGHPARLAIVEHLGKVDACICGDLVDELPLAQPTVSRHLRELKDAGLIRGTIEGTSVCYCLDHDAMAALGAFVAGLVPKGKKKQNCC
jgi:ArsR family transcriptional regulator